jgi:hypothetical protein
MPHRADVLQTIAPQLSSFLEDTQGAVLVGAGGREAPHGIRAIQPHSAKNGSRECSFPVDKIEAEEPALFGHHACIERKLDKIPKPFIGYRSWAEEARARSRLPLPVMLDESG